MSSGLLSILQLHWGWTPSCRYLWGSDQIHKGFMCYSGQPGLQISCFSWMTHPDAAQINPGQKFGNLAEGSQLTDFNLSAEILGVIISYRALQEICIPWNGSSLCHDPKNGTQTQSTFFQELSSRLTPATFRYVWLLFLPVCSAPCFCMVCFMLAVNAQSTGV